MGIEVVWSVDELLEEVFLSEGGVAGLQFEHAEAGPKFTVAFAEFEGAFDVVAGFLGLVLPEVVESEVVVGSIAIGVSFNRGGGEGFHVSPGWSAKNGEAGQGDEDDDGEEG